MSAPIDFEKMREQMRAEAAAKRAVASAAPSPADAAAAAARAAALWPPSLPLTAAQRVGADLVTSVHYVADWVSGAGAEALQQQLPVDDPGWAALTNRRLLNCGGVPHPSGMYGEALPEWFASVSERLVTTGVFDTSSPPNQVLLNEYDVTADGSGGGGIAPHNDGPLFDDSVAILTLGSPAVLHFWAINPASPTTNGWAAVEGRSPVCSVLLEPRSLLVFSGAAYTDHLHGILPVATETLPPTICNLKYFDIKTMSFCCFSTEKGQNFLMKNDDM